MALVTVLGATVLPGLWLPTVVSGNGWIEAVDSRTVRSPRPGRVVEMLVREGDAVRAGQPLVRLDDRGIAEELIDLEHELRLVELELERAAAERVVAGRDRVLARETAELDLIDARNHLLAQSFVYLNLTVDIDSLLSHHVPGRHIGIDEAVNQVRRIEARLAVLADRGSSDRLEELDSVRAVERIDRLRARRTVLEREREESTIRAPMEGVVQSGDLSQLPGRWLAEGEAILDVADPGSWQTRLYVPASGVRMVAEDAPVRITVPALADVRAEPLDGKVRHVGVRAVTGESSDGAFQVIASIEDDDESGAVLRAGFVVQAEIITEPMSLYEIMRGWLRRKSTILR